MNAIAYCKCGVSLGRGAQPGLPGTNTPELCITCTTRAEIGKMLALLPSPNERAWDALSEFEAEFLGSVRAQFQSKQSLSEKQFDCLARIYRKHA